MLKTILSISGKPGLFKLISQGKNMLIVESLSDNKRIPVYARDRVVSLGDIAIFTYDDEIPLHLVLTSIKDKEEAKPLSFKVSEAKPEELSAYLAEVLPDFDRNRVYTKDIKKLLSWYNLLINEGITEFNPQESKEEANDQEN